MSYSFFFFNDPATTDIYTLSLHDALPISLAAALLHGPALAALGLVGAEVTPLLVASGRDRKSTRLNSSHSSISYAVFCLKKKNFFSPPTPSCAVPLISPGTPSTIAKLL